MHAPSPGLMTVGGMGSNSWTPIDDDDDDETIYGTLNPKTLLSNPKPYAVIYTLKPII